MYKYAPHCLPWQQGDHSQISSQFEGKFQHLEDKHKSILNTYPHAAHDREHG